MKKVHVSDDGTLGYCEGAGIRGFWMTMEPQPLGTYQEKFPNPGLFTPYGVELKHPDGVSPSYERFVYPFTFWKITNRNRTVKELPNDDLFVLDYLLHQEWLQHRA